MRLLRGAVSPDAAMPQVTTTDRRIALWLFVTLAALFLLFQEGFISGSDGGTVFRVAQSIVRHGSIAVDPEFGIPGRNGQYVGRFAPALSLLTVPIVAVTEPLARALPEYSDYLQQFAAASLMPLIAAAFSASMYLLGRRLGAPTAPSIIVAIGSVLGTYALPYTRDFFQEPLAMLGLTLAVERWLAGREGQAGWAMGLAALARPQVWLVVPIFVLAVLSHRGLRSALRTIPGTSVAAAVAIGYNLLRFGDPLNFGYADVGFTTPLHKGLAILFIDVDKSLFLFAPATILLVLAARGAPQPPTQPALVLWSAAAILIVSTALYQFPHGDWAWGPRLLLPGIIPVLALLAPWADSYRRRIHVLAACFAFGAIVSAPTLIVSTRAQQLDPDPGSPGILRQYELVAPTVRYTAQHLFDYEQGRGLNYRYINTWQFGVLRVVGPKGLLLVLPTSGVLLSAAVYGAWRTRRLVTLATATAQGGFAPSPPTTAQGAVTPSSRTPPSTPRGISSPVGDDRRPDAPPG